MWLMVNRRKLLERLLGGSKNISFNEFTSLLEGFGFKLDRVRGSHHVYIRESNAEMLSVQPRKDGKAKPYQLRQLLKLIEEYNLELEDDKE
jgi:predicted RNA binding protein YcfA (HicA-like mRNA interferase family)